MSFIDHTADKIRVLTRIHMIDEERRFDPSLGQRIEDHCCIPRLISKGKGQHDRVVRIPHKDRIIIRIPVLICDDLVRPVQFIAVPIVISGSDHAIVQCIDIVKINILCSKSGLPVRICRCLLLCRLL